MQSGDVAAQYIPTMNAIFAAQRAEVSYMCAANQLWQNAKLAPEIMVGS